MGRCYEDYHGLPYAPFVEALRRALPSLDLIRLNLPDTWLAEIARLLPELGPRLPGLPRSQAADAAQEQQRLFAGIVRFLAALPQPAVLVIEDLQWADEATLLLLSYLARTPGVRRLAPRYPF